MTSCAMIAGMVPMALGLGEGGEQTAPLGRAVIGGLVAATLATLFVLPAVFALVMSGAPPGRRRSTPTTRRAGITICRRRDLFPECHRWVPSHGFAWAWVLQDMPTQSRGHGIPLTNDAHGRLHHDPIPPYRRHDADRCYRLRSDGRRHSGGSGR